MSEQSSRTNVIANKSKAAAQSSPLHSKNGFKTDSIYFKVKVPEQIVKRDGRITNFDVERIEKALRRCYSSLENEPKSPVTEINRQVVNVVSAKYDLPTVEGVQDIVEMVLQAAGEYEAAKHYILNRAEHAKMRTQRPVSPEVRDAFAASDTYFPTQLQKFQFYDKYSRFNYDLGRRETWIETVDRAVEYLCELSEYRLPQETYTRIRQGILDMKVMPSMRLLAMAGPAEVQAGRVDKWLQMYPGNFKRVLGWIDEDQSKAMAPPPENKAAAPPAQKKANRAVPARGRRKRG